MGAPAIFSDASCQTLCPQLYIRVSEPVIIAVLVSRLTCAVRGPNVLILIAGRADRRERAGEQIALLVRPSDVLCLLAKSSFVPLVQ